MNRQNFMTTIEERHCYFCNKQIKRLKPLLCFKCNIALKMEHRKLREEHRQFKMGEKIGERRRTPPSASDLWD